MAYEVSDSTGLGCGTGDWHLCKYFRHLKNADKVEIHCLCDFLYDAILSRKCMIPKSIFCVILIMKYYMKKRLEEVLTMIQTEGYLSNRGLLSQAATNP